MKLLHANDRRGEHAASWYRDTSEQPERPSLEQHREADVCVVGGGYTGLSAALTLAGNGYSVVLLEAHRLCWGASGRNGGQLGSGFNQQQDALERQLGMTRARALWDLCEDAKARVRDLCTTHRIDAHMQPGIITALHRRRYLQPLHQYADHLSRVYGYNQLEPLDAHQLKRHLDSPAYVGGALDHGGSHLHPLKFGLGLAEAAAQAGATLYERSEVIRLQRQAGNSDVPSE